MSDWLKSRRGVLPFVVAILVAEIYPFFVSVTPLTMEQWTVHTILVLIAAAILGVLMTKIRRKG